MSNDTNAQKRKEQIKKILVYGGMVMLCLVSFYFIFKPSKEQVMAEQQKVGFNAELPDPRDAGIEADKIPPTNWRICVSAGAEDAYPRRLFGNDHR